MRYGQRAMRYDAWAQTAWPCGMLWKHACRSMTAGNTVHCAVSNAMPCQAAMRCFACLPCATSMHGHGHARTSFPHLCLPPYCTCCGQQICVNYLCSAAPGHSSGLQCARSMLTDSRGADLCMVTLSDGACTSGLRLRVPARSRTHFRCKCHTVRGVRTVAGD